MPASRASSTNLDGGSIVFERIVGSFGASITPGDYFGQEDDIGESEHEKTDVIGLSEMSKE